MTCESKLSWWYENRVKINYNVRKSWRRIVLHYYNRGLFLVGTDQSRITFHDIDVKDWSRESWWFWFVLPQNKKMERAKSAKKKLWIFWQFQRLDFDISCLRWFGVSTWFTLTLTMMPNQIRKQQNHDCLNKSK